MWFKRLLAAALLFAPAQALAQGTQFPSGTLWGNNTAATRPGQVSTVSDILDRAFGSTRGAIIERGASGWALFAPSATARVPYLSGGTGADPLYGAYTLPASVTSGGVQCFTSTTVSASSALLTTNAIILGGGAGVCPSPMGSLGTTTTLLHGNAAGNPSFGQVVYADIAAAALATSANLQSGAASTIVSSSIIYDGEVTVTFAASQTLDFNTFLNARITATANTTSLTCSNIKASQSGAITWVQDGTGSRTMVAGWCSQFRWASGTRGVLSTAASSIDVLFYQCISTTVCYVSLSKAQAN